MDKAPEDECVVEVRSENPAHAAALAQLIDRFLRYRHTGNIKCRNSRNYLSYQELHERALPKNVFITVDKRNESTNQRTD